VKAGQIIIRGVAAAALAVGSTHLVQKVEACQGCNYFGNFPTGLWYSWCNEQDPGWDSCTPGGWNQDCTVGVECGNWG
jgi:hypothetical protein